MGQTLTNGIYLPAEGERNCYEGLAANWTALDGLVGGYNVHISNTTIHVTAADKEAWNGKADASALTAHTGNTTIHVTAEDKAKWDAVTSKANDSDVVHKSGNETVSGDKRFTNGIIRGSVNTNSTIQMRNLIGNTTTSTAGSNSSSYQAITATLNYSDSTPSKSVTVSLYVNENAYADGKYNAFRPNSNNLTNLGTSEKKWANVYAANYYYGTNAVEFSDKFVTTDTNQTITGNKTFSSINGVEPSSLSLPSNRSARIDISSYFTNTGAGQSNSYTVPANGYIYLALSELTNVHCFSRTSGNVINYAQTFTKLSNSTGALYILFPVRKNDVFVATWYTTTTVSVDGAFFIPCQGNI